MIAFGGFSLRPGGAYLAASFWQPVPRERLVAARKKGLAIAEIRFDLGRFDSLAAARAFGQSFAATAAAAGLAVLATARAREEGGRWARGRIFRDGGGRGDLLRAVLPFVDAVDIEIESARELAPVVAAARAARKTVVASRHFCARAPDAATLSKTAARALAIGDIGKIAARVSDAADLARLRKLAARELPLAVIGMGENAVAVESRAALPAAGSVIGFAREQGASAPGQMTVAQTARALDRLGMRARF